MRNIQLWGVILRQVRAVEILARRSRYCTEVEEAGGFRSNISRAKTGDLLRLPEEIGYVEYRVGLRQIAVGVSPNVPPNLLARIR